MPADLSPAADQALIDHAREAANSLYDIRIAGLLIDVADRLEALTAARAEGAARSDAQLARNPGALNPPPAGDAQAVGEDDAFVRKVAPMQHRQDEDHQRDDAEDDADALDMLIAEARQIKFPLRTEEPPVSENDHG